MKASNQSARLCSAEGNEVARARKLDIEVPSDDEELKEETTTPHLTAASLELRAGLGLKSSTPDARRSTVRAVQQTSAEKVFQFPVTSASRKSKELELLQQQAVSEASTGDEALPSRIRRRRPLVSGWGHMAARPLPLSSSGPAAATETRADIIHPPCTPQPRSDASSRLPDTQLKPRPADTKPAEGSNPSCLATLVTKVVPKSKPPAESASELKARAEMTYKEHLFTTFQALRLVRTLPAVDPHQLNAKKVVLPRRPGYEGLKTVVFDLDETLIHCVDDPSEPTDVRLPITFPNGDVIMAGINIRPYAVKALKAANQEFEVVVFTASHSCYADVVLDYLDPDHSLIHHRLYRQHCTFVDNAYIKDLRILSNRRLQDIVLVDNASYSFGYQLDNGIPIISWYKDRHDRELKRLIEYLDSIARAEDVRVVNRKTFSLHTFYEDYLSEYLKTQALSPKRPKGV
jgi:Dullard-like phosphatase family protein